MSVSLTTVRNISIAVAGAALVAAFIVPGGAEVGGTTLATVNGKAITEADLKLAEAEIGSELGQLPEATRRRVLVEYLADTQLYADAAEAQKLTGGPDFTARLAYWKRRAMRDAFFDAKVTGAVGDADARKFYDQQIGQIKPQDEVRAHHILVDAKEKATEIADKLAKGGDFAALAKEFSKDPGSKDSGGDLGFFGRGQMVPTFEAAAFALPVGQLSEPVKSPFGYHLILVSDHKSKSFDEVRGDIEKQIKPQLMQELVEGIRKKALIKIDDEYFGKP